jgi:Mn2+/Fe2+ NRAMP family transporter
MFKKYIGPGFLIAATGVGAGDMVAATVAGVNYGYAILWVAIVGAIFKYTLNEGIARWQFATNTTLIGGWFKKFHIGISYYFTAYLIVWSFIVAAALMAACGLAANAIFPQFSITIWGIIHSLVALLLVWIGKYGFLEKAMQLFIILMFVTIIVNLAFINPDWGAVFKAIVSPSIPEGSIGLIAGVVGGVGGSVTLLCYSYWLKEKGWNAIEHYKKAKVDLRIAYLLTGLFAVAIIILASSVNPEMVKGNRIILALAEKLSTTVGATGKWIFLIGFWGAVFSSMLGVWSGVPYIFNDIALRLKKNSKTEVATSSKWYKAYLLYLALPPMLLLFLDKPVWIIILYSIAGAFFMPFLAGLLLVMNNRVKWVSLLKNKPQVNIILILSLLLFVYLLVIKVAEVI